MSGLLFGLASVAAVLAAAELVLRWLDIADPPAFAADARSGYQMRPRQSVSTRGHRFRINNVGLRGADLGNPTRDERRVAFVGDSITYGGGKIPDSDLFVTRLAHAAGAALGTVITSVNVSSPGWGIQNMAGFIEARGTFAADVMVWVIPSADFRRRRTSLHDFGFPERRPRIRIAYVLAAWLRARKWLRRRTPLNPSVDSDPLTSNLGALDSALRALTLRQIPQIVVLVPDRRGFGHLSSEVSRFRATVEQNSATFISLERELLAHGADEVFEDGVHLTRRGHQIVADALLSTIVGALGRKEERGTGS
jgi:lysophospholipase L1-like esterase